MNMKMNNDRRWLDRMMEEEDYGNVSAGGLVARAAVERKEQQEPKETNPRDRDISVA
jgi:hypothetical protein